MMPISPCSAGESTWAEAWAMDAVPIPASLVKTPLAQPTLRARKDEPTIPPVTALGLNAPWIIAAAAWGRFSRRMISTPVHRTR